MDVERTPVSPVLFEKTISGKIEPTLPVRRRLPRNSFLGMAGMKARIPETMVSADQRRSWVIARKTSFWLEEGLEHRRRNADPLDATRHFQPWTRPNADVVQSCLPMQVRYTLWFRAHLAGYPNDISDPIRPVGQDPVTHRRLRVLANEIDNQDIRHDVPEVPPGNLKK